ncbi:MAG: hypothetical protein P8O16_14475 [Algoriphagus sp.]|uniref:hypothetical protein n=1 Tax=Algoriphagus sp. TaxID=1872435 RepID=UPI0026218D9A|nr:hypothetical protein [Algoriphagus sp.]MDG1278485.1 hypothetical protein [Algoriphagus sp.]
MARKFSDLHCHNHMRAHFHMQQKRKKFEKKGEFTPWTVIASNRKGYLKGKMGAAYSQADLVKAWNGNVRLTFNSLYPLERQFVRGLDKLNTTDLLHILIGTTTSHHLPLRDLIQVFYMRIPKVTVDHFQSIDYDYWESLQHEKDFVLIDSGVTIKKNEIHTSGVIRRIFENEFKRSKVFKKELIAERARYFIPKTRDELIKSLKDDKEITMILTIEGAHSLGSDRATIAELSRRVKYLKEEWEAPVFFITFAHHFNNRLCGHAHSIPDKGKILLNQSRNLNKGFNEKGRRIARELLGLNKNLERDPKFGYRILLDVKHMSAQSRKDYYEEIVLPCLMNGDQIPVIASHCGYSGIEKLQDLINNYDLEKDDYTDPKTNQFNAWNINVCDEDIEVILKTAGMFGLSFDQRILGITKKDKDSPRNGIQLLWENIEGIVKGVYSNKNLSEDQKFQIWKSMTIGTDFEGLIDPTDFYPTALEFEIFANNLVFEIDQARKKSNSKYLDHLQSREDCEKLVDDFCFNNAEAFAIRNFPIP